MGRQAGILDEVKDERARQDEQWGGPGHDDTHVPAEWFGFIQDQDDHFTSASLSTRSHDEAFITATARERLIKIAALAVAAVESIDRKARDGG